jgi:flagellar biosynthesis protein FlhA
MDTGKIEEVVYPVKVLATGEFKSGFIPWSLGDRGQQSYIKLRKKDETAYLYSGMGAVLQAEVQKSLMRLVNEGWHTEGEVHISFEGSKDPDIDRLLERDSISLELGAALLPLVDPYQGAPLLERLNILREEIAAELGIVISSVKLRDNLRLEQNQYIIKIRESPAAHGELYLDRFMAIGALEPLGLLQGWSVLEPTYRMPAKWIEVRDREKAEELGCMVQGALNVLLTHLKSTLVSGSRDILGLQETRHMLERLGNSHPVVVEEFLSDLGKLRKIRRVLQNLLAEGVPVRDLVTILEVIGDNQEDLKNISLMTEHVRRAISRQICWRLVDQEGILKAVNMSPALEQALINSLQDTTGGAYLYLEQAEEEKLFRLIRKTFEDCETAPVLITDPALRIYLWNLIGSHFPSLTVLSTMEVPQEIRVQITGEVKGSLAEQNDSDEKTAKKKRAKKFWDKK